MERAWDKRELTVLTGTVITFIDESMQQKALINLNSI